MPVPARCPYLHRCDKYADLTLRIDRLGEALAAKDREKSAAEGRERGAQGRTVRREAESRGHASFREFHAVLEDPAQGELDGGEPPAGRGTREGTRGVREEGVLGVDRYAAYGGAWKGRMQYCLEHYKRNVRDLLEEEPDNAEHRKFIPRFLDLLKEAMTLRSRFKGKEYDAESERVRDDILKWISQPVEDGRPRGFFDFMRETRHRFFQWVGHPEVEAENNLAERRLRPLVVARKVCFGSQSERGLRTRETLMGVIDTLKLRCDDPVRKLSGVLDALARNPSGDVGDLLWGSSKQQCQRA